MSQTISLWTDRGLQDALAGTYNLGASTLKAMLLKAEIDSGWTPTDDSTAKDTEFANTIASYEPSITGYTAGFGGAGRRTLASQAVTHSAGHSVIFNASSITWTALGTGATLGFVAIVRENTNDAGTNVLCILKLASNVVTNGGDVTVNWDSTYGIGRINNA